MSSIKPGAVAVTCNWKVGNEKELKSCLSLTDPKQEVDYDDLVTLDSCISLSRDGLDHSDLLEMTFKVVPDGVTISNIYIVSEARLLEVHGLCGEYQQTTQAVESDAGDEEMKVYNASIKLTSPSPECSVKFAGLAAGKTNMWVLGVGVGLSLASTAPNASSMAARVDKILQNSAIPLSASAENCKKLVMAQAISQQGGSPGGSVSTSGIQQYVDTCCEQLEKRLKLHMDERFDALQASLNDRLDLIATSLSKR